jgi:hypothetical protein
LNPNGLLDKIMRSICDKIEAHVSEHSFTFISKKGTFCLKTCVYLDGISGNYRIAAIGEEPINFSTFKKVDLFSKEGIPGKYELLEEYVKHGLTLTTSKNALTRPEIRCFGSENLSNFFNGYEQGILYSLFTAAGAVDVIFK